MCPLVNEMQTCRCIRTLVCVTGQHREMLEGVLKVFGVKPDYDLALMKEGQTLGEITARILMKLRPVLEAERPDMVLVHGDTASAFAAALACFYLQIPVGHVEAGLRTHSILSPFPEEFNRQAVGILACCHFAPTVAAADNLLREGKAGDTVFITGNTGIDAMKKTIYEGYRHPELTWARGSRLILLTAHRRENLGEPFCRMFHAIRRVVDENSDIKVIYPVHPSPGVQAAAKEGLGGHDRIHLIEPLGVLDFHNFLKQSYLILTDSGGIQEEAPGLGKPVLVLRDTTERPEGVKAGTLLLAGTEEEAVYQAFNRLLHEPSVYEGMSRAVNPYGDGCASRKITAIVERLLMQREDGI